MKNLQRVLIMAGGTGGHVFPGLALANYLREQGVDVHWLGTSQGLEARVVPSAQIPLHIITIGGLRGKGMKTVLFAPFRLSFAVWQAMQFIRKIKPDVVMGMGGFTSGPGGIASWLLRLPLVIHEQNARPGLTNRWLAKVAKRVLAGFPEAFAPQPNVLTVGNPVRTEIADLPSPKERSSVPASPFRLLVLGGSLGASALNEIVPRMLVQFPLEERPHIYHQTGEKHFDATKKFYEARGIQANLVPFIQDMADAYAWADLVLCRAGALTVAELCAAGLGAIFVPFPHAADDHQTANANYMVHHQAALLVPQSELTESRLADIIRQFVKTPEKRFAMAQAAYQLRQVKVVEKIVKVLCEVVDPHPTLSRKRKKE